VTRRRPFTGVLLAALCLAASCQRAPAADPGPGPDTDPLQGRITPELAALDPCDLLDVGEVAQLVPGSEDPDLDTEEVATGRTDHRQCTWRSGQQTILSLRIVALATTLDDTLAAVTDTRRLDDVLGLPGSARVALAGTGGPAVTGDRAIAVALDLGGGMQVVAVPGEALEVATPAFEDLLELLRQLAPRLSG
jgi:hypothetical protein